METQLLMFAKASLKFAKTFHSKNTQRSLTILLRFNNTQDCVSVWLERAENQNKTLKNSAHIGRLHCEVIMGAMASQITSLIIVSSPVYSGTDQRKRESSASLASVRGNHRWPVKSTHKRPVTRKMFPFDDVIIWHRTITWSWHSKRQSVISHAVYIFNDVPITLYSM